MKTENCACPEHLEENAGTRTNHSKDFAAESLLAYEFPQSLKDWNNKQLAQLDCWVQDSRVNGRVDWGRLKNMLPGVDMSEIKKRHYKQQRKARRLHRQRLQFYKEKLAQQNGWTRLAKEVLFTAAAMCWQSQWRWYSLLARQTEQ